METGREREREREIEREGDRDVSIKLLIPNYIIVK